MNTYKHSFCTSHRFSTRGRPPQSDPRLGLVTQQVMGTCTKAAPTEVPAIPRLRWCHGEYRTRCRPCLPCRWRDNLPLSVRESRLRAVCSLRQITLQSQTAAAGPLGAPGRQTQKPSLLCSTQETGSFPQKCSSCPCRGLVTFH